MRMTTYALNVPRQIWPLPRWKKELLQRNTVIIGVLLVASPKDYACCMATKHLEIFHTFSLKLRSRCSTQWEKRDKAHIVLMPLRPTHLDSWAYAALLCGGSTLNYSLVLAWTSTFLLARAIKSLARDQNTSRQTILYQEMWGHTERFCRNILVFIWKNRYFMFAASKWLNPKSETLILTNLTARSLLLSGDFNTILKIWNMDMKCPAAADTGSQKTLWDIPLASNWSYVTLL